MTTECCPNIYRLELELPNNPLRAVNCWMIRGADRNLIIDTGFNTPETLQRLREAMKSLGFQDHRTDFLITHLHSDHSGLAAHLAVLGHRVYAGRIDGAMINEMALRSYWERFETLNRQMGMAEDNITFEEHPGYKYCPKEPTAFTLLEGGDVIDLGGFRLQVVDIPGHTPGHIGLYEAERRLFFGGDHVLEPITPNIAFWGFEQDILAVYLESLDRVASLTVAQLFPAHRNVISDHVRRIEALKAHHRHRLEEILGILSEGPATVRTVASRMHWDLRISHWEQFPANQKWFAAGEAMSHLEHLYWTGQVLRMETEGVLTYGIQPGC